MESSKELNLEILGNKFRLARVAMGLSQATLAYKIGKDQQSINRLERGNINPSYIYLLEVCDGLGITLHELLINHQV